jgi:hypothetical protein
MESVPAAMPLPVITFLRPPKASPPIKHALLNIQRTKSPKKTNPTILPALIFLFGVVTFKPALNLLDF